MVRHQVVLLIVVTGPEQMSDLVGQHDMQVSIRFGSVKGATCIVYLVVAHPGAGPSGLWSDVAKESR